MSTPFQPTITRPLPRPLAPFPQETLSSYWQRLADANHVPVERLQVASRWLQPAVRTPVETADRLTLLTGQSSQALWRALPELAWWQESGTPTIPGSANQRWVCRRCAAAHAPGQQIAFFAPAHHHVCLRHGLWVGQEVHRPQDQVDLTQLPGTIRAQRWHHRLRRRYGDALITSCYQAARGFWRSLAARYFTYGQDEFHDITRKQAGARNGWGPGLYAMAYPSMVAVLSLAAVPSWRSIVANSAHPDDIGRVLAEFQRRLPAGTPALAGPTFPWLGQECAKVMRRMHPPSPRSKQNRAPKNSCTAYC